MFLVFIRVIHLSNVLLQLWTDGVFNRNTSNVLNNVKHYHLDIGANEAIIKQ